MDRGSRRERERGRERGERERERGGEREREGKREHFEIFCWFSGTLSYLTKTL